MPFDECIADFLVEVCKTLRPCFRISIRFSFFGLLAFVFASVVYMSIVFTQSRSPYIAVQGDIQALDPLQMLDADYKVDESACLTESDYAEQQAKAVNESQAPHPVPSKQVVPKLPWKYWNWCYPHPADFNFTIAEKGFCTNKSVPVLRLIVTTPTLELDRVKLRTAAARQGLAKLGIHTVFLLGVLRNDTNKQAVRAESEKYHDIIEVDISDADHYASLKLLAGLHWAVTYCSHAKYLYRAAAMEKDPYQQKVLNMIAARNKSPSPVGEIHCAQRSDILAPVLRKDSKVPFYAKKHWLISYTDYPEDFFPQYCIAAYVMPLSITKRLVTMWTWSRYFQLEGVYITGILPMMMGNATRLLLK